MQICLPLAVVDHSFYPKLHVELLISDKGQTHVGFDFGTEFLGK